MNRESQDDVFEAPFTGVNNASYTNKGFTEDFNECNGSSKRSGDFSSFQDKFLRSITARLTVAQVAASVKSGSDLTFDYLIYLIAASWISVMGLMENSVVSLVAAMLVSPLMNAGKEDEDDTHRHRNERFYSSKPMIVARFNCQLMLEQFQMHLTLSPVNTAE